MKKVLYLAFLFLISISFYSCKKTDNSGVYSSTNQNGFTVNSTFFNTEKAGIAIANDTFALIFYSTSVSFDQIEQEWKGIGHAVEFDELISSNIVNGFPVGNFIFYKNPQIGYFTEAASRTNYNFTADTGNERECVRGNINISKTGNQFQITYNLKNEDSSSLAGKFNGPIPDITNWFDGKNKNKD
ncbi:MAG: hypothetical protein NTW10_02495 [Bacteroidetes bacterium]|nr:hypothetical protein [Bacteroidota bacterium]